MRQTNWLSLRRSLVIHSQQNTNDFLTDRTGQHLTLVTVDVHVMQQKGRRGLQPHPSMIQRLALSSEK